MSFGRFDDEHREYVIDTPSTPFPWINYLGTASFYSIISNTAGGYSFYKDARLRRLTRYRYNDVPRDVNGRYIYINDSGDVWNPGWKPSKAKLDRYSCRHGLGYTVFESSRKGVEAEVTVFVPVDANCEIQRVRIKNASGARKQLSVWGSVEFCLYNALDDMSNFQRNLSTGEAVVEPGCVYHITEYRERRNHYAWFACGAKTDGWESDRDSFLGADRGWDSPRAVCDDAPSNSLTDGWFPMAAHRVKLDLAPGESAEFCFMLGYAENDPEKKWLAPGKPDFSVAKKMNERFFAPGAAQAALDAVAAQWKELLSRYTVSSGIPEFDRTVSIWNQYQMAVTANIARSASLFESGIGRGIGFRDTCQDLLGFVHLFPEKAHDRLLAVAATQFEDGGAYHQFQPLTGRGNADIGGDFNDDPLWLVLAVAAYVKETGDRDFLKVMVPFDHDPKKAQPLYEHVRRAFMKPVNALGPHQLPLIGRADWNDCLNLNCFSTDPNESFQTCTSKDGKTAESVFIAGLLVYAAPDFMALAKLSGDDASIALAKKAVSDVSEAVIKNGWDGDWYLRAYDDFGHKIGSKDCEEAKIWIEPQGMCSMARIGADKGFPRKSLNSVAKHLETEYGLVLLDPCYQRYHVELGEVSSYPPGYKENGGIFTHNNPWAVLAACSEGMAEEAWRWYTKIAPGWVEKRSELHRMEPYVFAQMIAGKGAKRHGEAKNSWLTGAASWTLVSAEQGILGVRPTWDGLTVDPVLPSEMPKVHVERQFRGARYVIDAQIDSGVKATELTVDGKPIKGTTVPLAAKGAVVKISVKVPARS